MKGHLLTRHWGIVIFLVLVFFAQMAFGSRQLSLTSDEPAHLGGGYTYLVTGDTWTVPSRGHPPLINAWTALPVVLADPHIPVRTLPNWGEVALPPYFRALLPLLGPVERLEVAGRVPAMLLGVILASLVFRWATDLFGVKGGVLALALMVFDPTMVAHAQLATTDVGVTMLGFATFFVGWRWVRCSREISRNPAKYTSPPRGCASLRWDIAMGLLCGATMAAKVSGLVWVGLALGITSLVELVCPPRSLSQRAFSLAISQNVAREWGILSLVLRRVLVLGAVAFLFLWGLYGFRVGPVRIGPCALTVPAPHHWEALIRQSASTSGRLMYLVGETRLGEGWWWYFPFAFLGLSLLRCAA